MAFRSPLGLHSQSLGEVDLNLYRLTPLSPAAGVALFGSRAPRSGRFRDVESPHTITYYFEPRLLEDRSVRRLLFKRFKSKDLTRDERVEIRALRKYADWTYAQIAKATKHTQRQVQTACSGPLTPQKHRSHDVLGLSDWQKHLVREFLAVDEKHLKIPWADLRFIIPELANYGTKAIQTAMKEMGYKRTPRRQSLVHSRDVRNKRIAFCKWVLQTWPLERYNRAWWLRNKPIVFSDETLGRNTPCGPQFLTIHQAEDPDSYHLARKQKNDKWMFWGAFAGKEKMPHYIWGKGTIINAEKYCKEIVPLIDAIMDLGYQYFMQDNAPAHQAALTQE